ncbi:MAG: hypothetical protein ABIV21_01835 [Pyrinomonadaceae bacterium]
MHFNNMFTRSLLALFVLTLVLSVAAMDTPAVDDRNDAWISVSTMIKFIGMGDASSVDRAGNDALGSLEKAVDKEQDSSKKDKLIDAKTKVREALGQASRGEWPYAEGAAKKALELIESVK